METLKKTVNQESYISRLVGLFPYYKDFFNPKRANLFEYIQPTTNCWGQCIPNLTVGDGINTTVYEVGSEAISNKVGMEQGVFSYRTIMDYYYRLYENSGIIDSNRYHWFNEDIVDKNKTFAQWVEMGIGRFLTPLNTEISDSTYEWLYLGLLSTYKEELDAELKNVYDFYTYRQVRLCAFDNGETDKFGFTYYKLTPDMLEDGTFSDKTYLYIDNDNVNGKPLNILLTYQSGDIIINNTTDHEITLRGYVRERKTIEGYNSFSYMFTIPKGMYLFHLQTIGDREVTNNFNERFNLLLAERVELDPSQFDIDEVDKGLCCRYNKFIHKGGWFYWQLVNSAKLADFISRIKAMFYAAAKDDKYNGVSRDTLDISFDLLFNNSSLDLGVLTPLIREWDDMEIYYSGDIVVFTNGENQTPKCYICRSQTPIYGADKSPIVTSLWERLTHTPSAWENAPTYTVSGKTHSKLKSLRRVKDYFDDYSEKVVPSFPEDWLFYYRIGAANINHLEVGETIYHYGDYLEAVDVSEKDRTITFTYWIDALLEASGNSFILKKDHNNGLFNGVKYVDVYTYTADSDLEKLVKGEFYVDGTKVNFKKYVDGGYDIYKEYNTENKIAKYFYENPKQFAFSGWDSVRTMTVSDGFSSSVRQYIECDYYKKSFYEGLDDLDYSYVVHHPYSLRMSSKPLIYSEVIVDRGNTQAFEKHIRLSEVKTLEDMVNFNNGSFFNMNDDYGV